MGCILPCDYIGIRFTQNTTQALIRGKLTTTPAFINVLAGQHCCVNKPTAHFTLEKLVVTRFVPNFILL